MLIKQSDSRSKEMVVFIMSGTAEVWVTKNDPSNPKARSKAQRLITLKAPFYIGEGRMFTGDPASATVRAAGTAPSFGFALFRASFDELMKNGNQNLMIMRRELDIQQR